MKYLKRPVTVEAAQWLGNNINEIITAFAHIPTLQFSVDSKNPSYLYVNRLGTSWYVPKLCWITYEEGMIYIATPDLFESLYVVTK